MTADKVLASLAWWVAAIQMMRILWRVAQQRRMTVATATQVDSDLGVHLETVSVIIPARNEAVNILPCLDAAGSTPLNRAGAV
jgi:hypothetical protein